MVTIPKLLVISKTVFHAFYNCDKKLCETLKKYNIVLPYALAVECVISENKSGKELKKAPDKLCLNLDKAIKAGANIGYQSAELLEEEKTTLNPINTIVNKAYTKRLRNSTLEINMDLIKQQAENYMDVTKRKIDELLGCAKRLFEDIDENKESMEDFCKPTNKEERFKKWIQNIDKNNFMNIAIEAWFGKQISSHADTNWFTWQCTRLWFAYIIDWCHKKSLRSSSEKKDISNDFYDMEPVLYLLHADGLLTNDTELEIPLAKAAFPNKDLFVVDTRVNDSRKVQDVFDDIVKIIPQSYRI